jgi:predicted peptidase
MRTLLMVVIVVAMSLVLCISCGARRVGVDAKELSVPTGFVFQTVKIAERSMDYVVYVPRAYAPTSKWPAIVFLHGSGESGTDGQKQIAQGIGTNILWNADRWPCIVMMPQKPTSKLQWEDEDDLVMKMLEETRKEYAIDGQRIALTGLSQGGHGTWSIGAAHPEIWCALAPICGYTDQHEGKLTAEGVAAKLSKVPMWVFHGEDDDVVSPDQSRSVVEAMQKAGAADVRLTLYPKTNHGSWDKAYAEKDLPGFLMTSKKK